MNTVSRIASSPRRLLAILLLMWSFCPASVALAAEADVRRVWQILDYLSVDYAGAVQGGKVIAQSEFDEMREFVQTARDKITALEPKPEQAALLQQVGELESSIKTMREPAQVAAQAKALANHLIAVYPVPLAPSVVPDLRVGQTLYAAQCASCHGTTGNGDGPLARQLDPKPIAFTDHERARQRSVFALYQVVSQGIAGTAMPAFGQLSDQDRWSIATYLGTFAHDAAQVNEGKKLWTQDRQVQLAIPDMERFVRSTEVELGQTLGERQAQAAMAYLHTNPDALTRPGPPTLALASTQLRASVAAYESNDFKKAKDAALSSYLDGIEPYEQALAVRDPALKEAIESEMGRFRALLAEGATVDRVRVAAVSLEQRFAQADAALQPSRMNTTAAFFGSLTILLREGIEALLVVVAMVAFLRKAQRPDVLAYVHAGWLGALVAGGVTWAIATHLVAISGANREVTEGLSSLFAAAVLLSVGVWMHQKSVAGQWQAYLQAQMSAALDRKSAVFMFGLAFVAVYREVFETILFYAALWGQGSDGAILAGLVAGAACLVAITVLLLRFSARLPLGKFFAFSAWLVAVLAVVLTGKGIAALQEAGWLPPGTMTAPRLEWLGIYPSMIGLVAQAVVLAFVIGFFLRRTERASAVQSP